MMLIPSPTPSLLRSLAHHSAAIHTLPKLPYAYNVSNNDFVLFVLAPTYLSLGSRAAHLGRNYGTAHTMHHTTYSNGLNAAEDAYFKAPSTRDQTALHAARRR